VTKSTQVTKLFSDALLYDRELQQAARAQERGSLDKLNPYITDFGKCPRAVGYSLLNEPVTNPPGVESLANFLFGHAAEDAYAKVLEQYGLTVIREVRVEVSGTSGRIDFLLWSDDLETLIEMKTSKGFQLRFLPNEQHIRQLNGYLHAGNLGLLKDKGIEPSMCESGVLLYIMKDATKGKPVFLPFDIPYDEAQALQDLDTNDAIRDMLPNLVPRPAGYKPNSFPCGWCDWRDTCWST
jgi:hypothetical protein